MNVCIRYGWWKTQENGGKVFHDVNVSLGGNSEMVKLILEKLKELEYNEF